MITPDQVEPGMQVEYRPAGGGKPEQGKFIRFIEADGNINRDLAMVSYGGVPKATYIHDLYVVTW